MIYSGSCDCGIYIWAGLTPRCTFLAVVRLPPDIGVVSQGALFFMELKVLLERTLNALFGEGPHQIFIEYTWHMKQFSNQE